jgi:uncharacterized protein YbjT (DUF2867 family)
MHILVTGAAGFIGRHICARLLRDGHAVTAAVRAPASIARRFPGMRGVAIDMNRLVAPDAWAPLLAGVDAVVNCAGVLQSGRGQSATAIHATAPKALFDACVAAGIARVVQISAVSADAAAGTEYALSKQAADDHLRGLALDWVVLRPSLVYAQGSYGGTSLLRGIAGLPVVMPLPGGGAQQFQPIHADDLAETVLRCLTGPALARRTLEPVGPEILSMRQILERLRAWLDLPPARPLRIPLAAVRWAARLGDAIGRGPLRSTALARMDYGNTGDFAAFAAAIGFRPRSMAEAFAAAPSHVQDRWHARLYFLRPLSTATLAALWLGSGIAGLVDATDARATAAALGLAPPWATAAAIGFSVLDLAIGAALVAGRVERMLGPLQFALIALYTLGFGSLMPRLWLDPLGRLVKNLPILATVALWMALRDDR